MKKVVIIGGGIAGLTAGIYALRHGFDVEIYEKNPMAGGECTAWDRQGYHIDNCIHWLTGCRPTDELREIWETIGALSDSVPLYRELYFYSYEADGNTLRFWSDLEKSRSEFLALAPEDKKEINRFFDNVRRAECIRVPCKKSLADMGPFEYMRFGMSMSDAGKMMSEYGSDTVDDLAARFKNPIIRAMMGQYFPGNHKAITLITSYAFYTGGTAAIPEGGSAGMVRRIVERYRSLGGKLYTGMTAEKINIEGKRAVSAVFSDGTVVPFDYVICAADPSVTFGRLLDRKYMDEKLRRMYDCPEGYPVYSGFHVSFGITDDAPCGIRGSVLFPCERFTVGTQEKNCLGVRMYDYDETLFPASRRVIQCNTLQNEADYAFWQDLYSDRERYRAEKQRIADDTYERIVAHYPALEGRLVQLCTYSPMTFTGWCGAYKGAYMSFFERVGRKSLTAKNSVNGLSNVFIGSQWTTTSGGLPTAAASGRFAADAVARADRKSR